MRPRTAGVVIALTVSLLCIEVARAQVDLGTAITFQGRLVHAGTPINGTCTLTFQVFDALDGPAQVGPTQVKNVLVTDGLCVVPDLDFGAGVFTGSARWLEVTVDCGNPGDPTTLDPRIKLTPAPYALALPGLYTEQTGTSPNIIGGFSGNTVTAGVIGATIAGGGANGSVNTVSNSYGTVSGGAVNTAGADYATVGGGGANTAGADGATVGGGAQNFALGALSTIAGGEFNQASNQYSSVGGGHFNFASGLDSTIGGGAFNSVSGYESTVGGGANNTASGPDSTVGGGLLNTADGPAQGCTVGGGLINTASGYISTVGGGFMNTAIDSTIGGGDSNTAVTGSTIGGGKLNIASGIAVSVGGGYGNTASGGSSTVGGGFINTASGDFSTIGGGISNSASGLGSTVPGGGGNVAGGNFSFAAGNNARVRTPTESTDSDGDEGTFVWADDPTITLEFISTGPNQFLVRAEGGVGIGTNAPAHPLHMASGAHCTAGGVWTDSSDRNAKENFEPLDGRAALERLAGVSITRWNFKAQDAAIQHIGPTAQDFHAAFATGEDDRHLAALDTAGVALAAIQGLHEIVQQKDCEITELREQQDRENAELREKIAKLEGMIADLSRKNPGGQ